MEIPRLVFASLLVLVCSIVALATRGTATIAAVSARGWIILSAFGIVCALVSVTLVALRGSKWRGTPSENSESTRGSLPDVAEAQIALAADGPSYPHPVVNVQTCIGCHACVDACPHDVLAMVNGKAVPIAIEQCMEDVSCEVECPTVPKSCIVVNATRKIPERKVPRRNEKFLTNVDGVYLIGDVSGVPLIKNAINEGGAVIDFLVDDLSRSPGNGSADYDVAVVGMGPAGVSATILAHKRGLKYIAIEQDQLLSTIQQSYQAGKYIYFNPADQPVCGGIALKGYGAVKEEILSEWLATIRSTQVRIQEFERCVELRRLDDRLLLVTEHETERMQREYTCRRVILAIGNRGMPMKLAVPGENLPGPAGDDKVKYRLSDPSVFQAKQIVVVGAGNSAVEAAIDLAAVRSNDGTRISAWRNNAVALVIRTDFKGDLKLKNKMMIYDCIDAGMIKPYFGRVIKEITSSDVVFTSARRSDDKSREATERIRCDYVFCLIGGEKPTRFLEKIGIQVG